MQFVIRGYHGRMKRTAIKRIGLFLLLFGFLAAAASARNLEIYWIDVEGGASTLIISPSGQSLLVDTGNFTPDNRDAKRIYETAKQAGLTKIDYLITTHFHGDHVGGVAALAKMMPIEHFLDHGDSIEQKDPRSGPLWKPYLDTAAGKRMTLKPGDKLPVKGLDAIVVAANGQVISKPVNGGGPNPNCAGAQTHPADTTENQRSVGFLLTFGKFKFLDLGDLTWDKEMELACPENKVGTVTLFQATHHGFVNDFSGAPAHILALQPQVVIVNNGPTKGLQNSAWQTISNIKGLEDVWQIHQAMGPNHDHNTKAEQIANPEPTDQCKGNWIKASIESNGKFTITNGRNSVSKSYTAR